MKLGREYLLTTQELDIYGTASAYKGPVLILHGTKDKIVPLWCSDRYKENYGEKAELLVAYFTAEVRVVSLIWGHYPQNRPKMRVVSSKKGHYPHSER